MRRADMPTFLASLCRQWSFVSDQPRGPPMAISMGRALSRADAADIALASAEIDGFSVTACSMVEPMSEAEDRRSCRTERIGEALRRVAARLATQRNRRVATPQDVATRYLGREETPDGLAEGERGAATPGGSGAAARHPAGVACQQSAGGLDAQMNGPAADVDGNRRADVACLRVANGGDALGRDVESAASPPRAAETAKGPTPSHAVSAAPLG